MFDSKKETPQRKPNVKPRNRTPPIAPRPPSSSTTVNKSPIAAVEPMVKQIVEDVKPSEEKQATSPAPPMLNTLNEADDDEAPPMLAPMLRYV